MHTGHTFDMGDECCGHGDFFKISDKKGGLWFFLFQIKSWTRMSSDTPLPEKRFRSEENLTRSLPLLHVSPKGEIVNLIRSPFLIV